MTDSPHHSGTSSRPYQRYTIVFALLSSGSSLATPARAEAGCPGRVREDGEAAQAARLFGDKRYQRAVWGECGYWGLRGGGGSAGSGRGGGRGGGGGGGGVPWRGVVACGGTAMRTPCARRRASSAVRSSRGKAAAAAAGSGV